MIVYVNETQGIESYIMIKLNANANLVALVADRIYRGKIPKDGGLPAVVFHLVTSQDVQTVAGERIMTRPIYIVKAVDTADSPLGAMAIATEIDKALNKSGSLDVLSNPTLHVVGGYRTEIVNFQEEDQDINWYHIGGQYRFVIHNA